MSKSPIKELWEEVPMWFKLTFLLMIIVLFLSLLLCNPKQREPQEGIDFPSVEEMLVTSLGNPLHNEEKPIYVHILVRKKFWVF